VTLINPNWRCSPASCMRSANFLSLIPAAVEFPQLLESEHPEEGEGNWKSRSIDRGGCLSLPAPSWKRSKRLERLSGDPPETLSDTSCWPKVLDADQDAVRATAGFQPDRPGGHAVASAPDGHPGESSRSWNRWTGRLPSERAQRAALTGSGPRAVEEFEVAAGARAICPLIAHTEPSGPSAVGV